MLLVIAALIFLVSMLTFDRIHSEFAGLYLITLTLPWSILETMLLDYLHIQDSVPIVIKIISLIVFGVINALIIYRIGKVIERS